MCVETKGVSNNVPGSGGGRVMKKMILCVAGALLFILGALFERHLWGEKKRMEEKALLSSAAAVDGSKGVSTELPPATSLPIHLAVSSNAAHNASIPRWNMDGDELKETLEWVDRLKTKEKKIFSQNGEDGIIEAIFDRIGEGEKYYVEFGTENGAEVNTRFLREQKKWKGLLMDGGHSNPAINLHKEFITASGICALFEKYKVPHPSIDLLSVDVDFLDFHVLKRILECGYKPRVLIVEHNSALGEYRSATVPSSLPESSRWDGTNYFGASILAFSKLAREYNLSLLYVDKLGVNLFFVADKELGEIDIALANWVREKFMPPGYGKDGHPPDRLVRVYEVV